MKTPWDDEPYDMHGIYDALVRADGTFVSFQCGPGQKLRKTDAAGVSMYVESGVVQELKPGDTFEVVPDYSQAEKP